MEREEIIKRIEDYLKAHRKMTIATMTHDGKPLAHTVEYVSDGATVYFMTYKYSRKAGNIPVNPDVSYCVDDDDDDWLKIQGVQMSATARKLGEGSELTKVKAMYLERFPFLKHFPKQDMSIVDLDETVFFAVTPVEGHFIDNTQGFGTRLHVKF